MNRARARGLEKDDNFPHLVIGGEPRIADKPPDIFDFDAKADAKLKIDAAHDIRSDARAPARRWPEDPEARALLRASSSRSDAGEPAGKSQTRGHLSHAWRRLLDSCSLRSA